MIKRLEPTIVIKFIMRRRHSFINVELTTYSSPHERGSVFRNQGNVVHGIQNPRKFCLWNLKSWALESEVQLKESGIPLNIGIQNPSSTFPLTKTGIQCLQSGIQGVESRIQDCLGLPYLGRYSSSTFTSVCLIKLVSSYSFLFSLFLLVIFVLS